MLLVLVKSLFQCGAPPPNKLFTTSIMSPIKKRLTCEYCRSRRRYCPSIYCYRHRGITANQQPNKEEVELGKSTPDTGVSTIVKSAMMLVPDPLMKGCPLLSNVLFTQNVDTSLCLELRMEDKEIDVTSTTHRIQTKVPLRLYRKLEPVLQNILRLHFKDHGKFQLAGPIYSTSVKRRRNTHVS